MEFPPSVSWSTVVCLFDLFFSSHHLLCLWLFDLQSSCSLTLKKSVRLVRLWNTFRRRILHHQGLIGKTRCPTSKHTCVPFWRTHLLLTSVPALFGHPQPPGTRRKAETFAAPSEAAQNKQHWSSLLLGISLRAGARASAGGGELGVFWWLQSYKCAALLLSSVGSGSRQSNQPNARSAEAALCAPMLAANPELSIRWDDCGWLPLISKTLLCIQWLCIVYIEPENVQMCLATHDCETFECGSLKRAYTRLHRSLFFFYFEMIW